MKKIYLIFLILIGVFVSCTKDFEEYNIDDKKASAVPGAFLFSNAQKVLTDEVVSINVNENIWKLISQYWTETTYTDESNYDIINRSIPDIIYRNYYRDILNDLKDAKRVIEQMPAIGEGPIIEKQNQLYIIDLVMTYAWADLLCIFGDIPYSEALDIDNISPKYDDAFTVYQDLFTKLDAAINGLNDGYGSFGTADLYFNGDVSMWKKFANTLKIRIAILLADYDENLARTAIESAYQGAFQYGEKCELLYPGGTNSNPIYQDLVQSGRNDFVPANTIVDMMNALNDPRRDEYFDPNGEAYVGGIYGESNSYSQYSHVSSIIEQPTFPGVMLDYTELAFYLAEAAERGFSVGNNAEYYYNSGIESSIVSWGGTEEDAAEYISQQDVSYATAPGNWKQKIGTQAWLALYIRGLEGYNVWRRLDFPILNLPPAPETPDGQVPKRFTYPVNEQTLNKLNYEAAAAKIGGDFMDTKLFWDKF
jgi:hypothetical protein